MIDLVELLQPHKGRKMSGFCRDADVCVHSGKRAVNGHNVRVQTAIKMIEHLGYKPPCKVEEVGDVIRELWGRNPKNSTILVGYKLGINPATINRWLNGKSPNLNYINFLMFCKHLSEDDAEIHNYKFGAF